MTKEPQERERRAPGLDSDHCQSTGSKIVCRIDFEHVLTDADEEERDNKNDNLSTSHITFQSAVASSPRRETKSARSASCDDASVRQKSNTTKGERFCFYERCRVGVLRQRFVCAEKQDKFEHTGKPQSMEKSIDKLARRAALSSSLSMSASSIACAQASTCDGSRRNAASRQPSALVNERSADQRADKMSE